MITMEMIMDMNSKEQFNNKIREFIEQEIRSHIVIVTANRSEFIKAEEALAFIGVNSLEGLRVTCARSGAKIVKLDKTMYVEFEFILHKALKTHRCLDSARED